MILIIPILLYFLLVVGIIHLVDKKIKDKESKIRRRARRRIVVLSWILFFVLGVYYLLFLFSIALERHYDVKKGTFLWYATMDNETITNFPILQAKSRAVYNSIGGDSPNIGAGWEIEYNSGANRFV